MAKFDLIVRGGCIIDPGSGIDHTAAADNQVELRHCVSPRPGLLD